MTKVQWHQCDEVDRIMDAIPDKYWMVKHRDNDIEEFDDDEIEPLQILTTW
jgi:hypothetical protein